MLLQLNSAVKNMTEWKTCFSQVNNTDLDTVFNNLLASTVY